MLKAKRKIVISLHGIRTRGEWQKELASVISENGWIYYPLDYGYFGLPQFARPALRREKIVWFLEEYTRITERYENITPSVVAHSNGTYIVANALLKHKGIELDKIIFCGSIVQRDFDWKTIFDRGQATLVLNEIGRKDKPAKYVHCLAWGDTGPSGQKGFLNDLLTDSQKQRLRQIDFPFADHATFKARIHYRKDWIPFLEEAVPYQNQSAATAPSNYENLVSAQDAARWSAMTYFHQYILRVRSAIVDDKVFKEDKKTQIPARKLCVVIPKTPEGAEKNSYMPFYQSRGLNLGYAGDADPRSVRYLAGEVLYDIPTTLNTLAFLGNCSDGERAEAVIEFSNCLTSLIERKGCTDVVEIVEKEKLPPQLA